MSDPRPAVRLAFYQRMLAAGLAAPVFSRPPDGQEPPYVTLGDITLTGPMSKDADDWEVAVEVNTVVKARSPITEEQLSAQVVAALNDWQPAAAGLAASSVHLSGNSPGLSEDNLIYTNRQTFGLFASAI